MSIESAIAAKQQQIADSYTAISNKGGTLPVTQNLTNLATAISSIPSSGGSITYNDFDSKILHIEDEYSEKHDTAWYAEGFGKNCPTTNGSTISYPNLKVINIGVLDYYYDSDDLQTVPYIDKQITYSYPELEKVLNCSYIFCRAYNSSDTNPITLEIPKLKELHYCGHICFDKDISNDLNISFPNLELMNSVTHFIASSKKTGNITINMPKLKNYIGDYLLRGVYEGEILINMPKLETLDCSYFMNGTYENTVTINLDNLTSFGSTSNYIFTGNFSKDVTINLLKITELNKSGLFGLLYKIDNTTINLPLCTKFNPVAFNLSNSANLSNTFNLNAPNVTSYGAFSYPAKNFVNKFFNIWCPLITTINYQIQYIPDESLSFDHITSITANYPFRYSNNVTDIYFPVCNAFARYTFSNMNGLTRIHLNYNYKSTIEALQYYSTKFGANSTAKIFFDINGVGMNYLLENADSEAILLVDDHEKNSMSYWFQPNLNYNLKIISPKNGIYTATVNYNTNIGQMSNTTITSSSFDAGYLLTITSNVQDPLITLTYNNHTFTTNSAKVAAGTSISYKVAKEGYVPQRGTITVNDTQTINVVLNTGSSVNVDLNPSVAEYGWIESERTNPKASDNWVMYESNNKGESDTIALMKVTFVGNSFTCYLNCYSEQECDYSYVSQIDSENYQPRDAYKTAGYDDYDADDNLMGFGDPTLFGNYREISFSNLTDSEHYFYIGFTKDGSVDSHYDAGFLLFDPNQ